VLVRSAVRPVRLICAVYALLSVPCTRPVLPEELVDRGPATPAGQHTVCSCRPWTYPADTPQRCALGDYRSSGQRAAMTPTTTNPLFKFGVDLRRVDAETGRTALHSAAMFLDAEKVTACLARLPAFTSSGCSGCLQEQGTGLPVRCHRAPSRARCTCLPDAVPAAVLLDQGQREVGVGTGAQVHWLLGEGLDVEARDSSGARALHLATAHLQRPVMQALLEAGADVNAADGEVRAAPSSTGGSAHRGSAYRAPVRSHRPALLVARRCSAGVQRHRTLA